jgi:Zn-dependent peptidase ImmA (M78 family)
MAQSPTKLARQVFQNTDGTIPVDVDRIAAESSITIRLQAFEDSVSGILVVRGDEGIIAVNQNHHRNRQRFTIAHEIGHFLIHRESTSQFIDSSPVFFRGPAAAEGTDKQEIEANQFAAELLMPEDVLTQRLGNRPMDAFDENAVRRLASLFGVSAQALTIRLTRLNLVADYFVE